jgi:2-keto-4-pentenoate hydratase/2-oxohepta-3-ene-1,7-dioic acid hydratase in catechol pathway
MLIAQTDHGIARITADELEILDDSGRQLDDFIIHGQLDELDSLKARTAVGWDNVTLAPPVRRPGKIVIVGLNYRDHAAEIGSPVPDFPRFHLIPGSAVIAGGAVITLPAAAPDNVDYEGELAIVIGRTGRDIPESEAWDFVAGATVANDVSARDIQFGDNPGLPMPHPALAKGFDGFKPLGPALLTVDELRQHDALHITTEVNGIVRQHSSTSELIFSVPQLLAFTSSFLTLEAGDVLLTGTPAGTGVAEGRFLVPDDVVGVAVEHIGTLINTFTAEAAATRGVTA